MPWTRRQGDVDFPKDLPAEPNIFELNFSEMMPVMNINLSGDYSIDQLHHYAKILEDRIEALPEINKVDIRGVPEKEVKVNVDVHQLEALKLNFRRRRPGAPEREPHHERGRGAHRRASAAPVRVIGEFSDMDMIRDIVIKNEHQEEVRLRDVADVSFDFKEGRQLCPRVRQARGDGRRDQARRREPDHRQRQDQRDPRGSTGHRDPRGRHRSPRPTTRAMTPACRWTSSSTTSSSG
jgi:multidrug efflux pump subunit AcrB